MTHRESVSRGDRVAGAVVGSAAGRAGRPVRSRPRRSVHRPLPGRRRGAVWPCLGTALWALRTTDTFERALAAAVDVGGDTDTVAAVTGGLAGAVYGIETIPARWTEPLHVPLPGHGGRRLTTGDLLTLTGLLAPKVVGAAENPLQQYRHKSTHKRQIRALWG